ncbi:unnamed protein product [Euphydryas editha]|uniref:Reverse transcriptase domain-containing protein n=1 Tax=Euphydryas editha TaxID=104508 RepID=A0AAU9TW06_EUPED|nr:unnamed protein product [Euphydryas editha]
MPEIWKRSYVVPIFKSGDKHNVDNYRPISKLSTVAKLFEKIVYDNIYPNLRPFLISQQHGFVDGRSTERNLCEFLHRISIAIDQGFQVDVVYIDYSKAFDRIPHAKLINKLEKAGIHGDLLRWLSSYLENRSQAETVKGRVSSFVPVSSGVPQGSHLGPLLFNVFINDINSVFKNSGILLYADEMKIFRCISDSADYLLLQSDLNKLCEYCSDNSMSLNIRKCQVISFSRMNNAVLFHGLRGEGMGGKWYGG